MTEQTVTAEINGVWYSQGSSHSHGAVMRVYANEQISITSQRSAEQLFAGALAELTIPARLGNTARHIDVAEAGQFETAENDQVDAVLAQQFPRHRMQWVHKLESHWRMVMLAMLLLAGFVWAVIQFGIPLISKEVARTLPPDLAQQASTQTMRVLDSKFFSPSQLTSARQADILNRFNSLFNLQDTKTYQLVFRHSDKMGANAMALPDGHIVMTDELVTLSANDNELMAVLAHEVGHVKHQHGMRGMVQNSLMVFLTMALTGDSSGVAEVFLGLPIVLMNNAYSRDFEREADRYAHDFMQSRQMPLKSFADILDRMSVSVACQQYLNEPEQIDNQLSRQDCFTLAGLKAFRKLDVAPDTEQQSQWKNYLQTHPSNEERTQLFR